MLKLLVVTCLVEVAGYHMSCWGCWLSWRDYWLYHMSWRDYCFSHVIWDYWRDTEITGCITCYEEAIVCITLQYLPYYMAWPIEFAGYSPEVWMLQLLFILILFTHRCAYLIFKTVYIYVETLYNKCLTLYTSIKIESNDMFLLTMAINSQFNFSPISFH